MSYSVEPDSNHTVADSTRKVNDNDYHVVSFVRAGTAAVLRVDDQLVQSIQTPGIHPSSEHRDFMLRLHWFVYPAPARRAK